MNLLEVKVLQVFRFSNGWLVAIMQSEKGILEDGTILVNSSGKRWRIQFQQHTTGSVETYEILKEEASNNIYQYRISGIEDDDVPGKLTTLYIDQ